jgi:hypothetical protein
MPSAEGLIVNATNRPIAAISQPAIRPARECDLSREFFDVWRSSGVAISVYPKLLVFSGYQESGGGQRARMGIALCLSCPSVAVHVD